MTIATTLAKLADSSNAFRHRDLRGLSDIGTDREAEVLRGWQPIELERRRVLVHAMVELAEENVEFDFRDLLAALLADPDAEVRQTAVEGLWEDERMRVFRRLLALLLDDPALTVRAAAALSLGQWARRATLNEIRPDAAAELRAGLLAAAAPTTADPELRRRALESVGYFEGADVTELIATAYAAGQPRLKESALVAIGHNLDERWLPVLQTELQSPTAALRYEAARATSEFGAAAQSLLQYLIPLTEEADVEVAGAAVWAIGQIGGPVALRLLDQLKGNGRPAIQQAAEEALAELRIVSGESIV